MNWIGTGDFIIAMTIAITGAVILDALKKLNTQIGNVRFYLGELDTRQQRIADKLHAIECHTARAVKDEYERDDWERRQPPI